MELSEDYDSNDFTRENPSYTYEDRILYCDRNGVLDMGNHTPDGMAPIVEWQWFRLRRAAIECAVWSDGCEWIIPGVAEANSDDALDAVLAFRERLLAALRGNHG